MVWLGPSNTAIVRSVGTVKAGQHARRPSYMVDGLRPDLHITMNRSSERQKGRRLPFLTGLESGLRA